MGMAIKISGYNDYSIKMMNGILDIYSILLIFMIASILAKNFWVDAANCLIYAFLPGVSRRNIGRKYFAEKPVWFYDATLPSL
jgi:hypothetical protein